MKKNHKNDKRRITARERMAKFFEEEDRISVENGFGHCVRVPSVDAYALKMLQDHANATLARYKRKLNSAINRVVAEHSDTLMRIGVKQNGR